MKIILIVSRALLTLAGIMFIAGAIAHPAAQSMQIFRVVCGALALASVEISREVGAPVQKTLPPKTPPAP